MTAAPRLRRGALIGLLIPLTGCASWTPSVANPRDVVASRPAAIRVQRPDGTRVEIVDPTIQNDSIAEVSSEQQCIADPLARRSCASTGPRSSGVVALQDVRSIEVRRTAWGRSIALGIAAVPVAWGLLGVILCSTSGCY
jgi:hypothetical protein